MITEELAYGIAQDLHWPSLGYALSNDGARLNAAVKALVDHSRDEAEARSIASQILQSRAECPTYAEVAMLFSSAYSDKPLGRSGCLACNGTGFVYVKAKHTRRTGEVVELEAVDDCECHRRKLGAA